MKRKEFISKVDKVLDEEFEGSITEGELLVKIESLVSFRKISLEEELKAEIKKIEV